MNCSQSKACHFISEWMVPPLLIPLALILMIAIWVAVRPHLG
ncbi:protein of unknown function [Magnetospirillum sp. XM-1]|nr:protein of unknown function [Magnetospirillum sp. XM-1]